MAGMDWFRWHHGSVNDQKFQLVAKRAGASVAEVVAVWACMLEAASSADERGNVGALDFESIDCAMGLQDGKSAQIHAAMIARNLVDDVGNIVRWASRQPKREREDSVPPRPAAPRGRADGSKPLATTCNQSEPTTTTRSQLQPNAASYNQTQPTTTKKSLEESRVDKRRKEEGGSAGERGRDGAPPSPPDGGPPPFSDEDREFIQTERPDLDPALVFRNFCDHYPAPKRSAALWRKWVRREMPPTGQARDSPGPKATDPDSRSSIEALGVSLGLGRWSELAERWDAYKARVNEAATGTELTGEGV